jgi:hypothetical protein
MLQDRLVSVMMPFASDFGPVFKAIKGACEDHQFECLRASDIWSTSPVNGLAAAQLAEKSLGVALHIGPKLCVFRLGVAHRDRHAS